MYLPSNSMLCKCKDTHDTFWILAFTADPLHSSISQQAQQQKGVDLKFASQEGNASGERNRRRRREGEVKAECGAEGEVKEVKGRKGEKGKKEKQQRLSTLRSIAVRLILQQGFSQSGLCSPG